MSSIEDACVRQVVTDWAEAVSRADREGILSRHANDLLMYDFPSEVCGLDAYNRTWDFFFSEQVGPLTFAPSAMKATVGGPVAFVTCTMHCDGTTAGRFDFRLTVGLEKRDGEWTITHEHHSVRTTEDQYVDKS
ncbi:MAG TPA: nuclear transport factor 2 family protein [Lautropia sp.]|jgi:ketosteroid isomerase-like protein|nr:nuclear transport factor 2 family protein [Lautropia sp.]